jgi:hypothetical protein
MQQASISRLPASREKRGLIRGGALSFDLIQRIQSG